MNKFVKAIVMLVAGAGLGGGAAYGTDMILGGSIAAPGNPSGDDASPAQLASAGTLLAPLVLANGHLSGYVSFDVEFEVGEDDAEYVAALQPLFAHELNLRTYRAPLAAGPDGLLPDLDGLREVVDDAATAAFGEGVVRRSLITKAVPA